MPLWASVSMSMTSDDLFVVSFGQSVAVQFPQVPVVFQARPQFVEEGRAAQGIHAKARRLLRPDERIPDTGPLLFRKHGRSWSVSTATTSSAPSLPGPPDLPIEPWPRSSPSCFPTTPGADRTGSPPYRSKSGDVVVTDGLTVYAVLRGKCGNRFRPFSFAVASRTDRSRRIAAP